MSYAQWRWLSFGSIILILLMAAGCANTAIPAGADIRPSAEPVDVVIETVSLPTATIQPGSADLAAEPTSVIQPSPVPAQAGYPRIANLWGLYEPGEDALVYAGFDLYVPYVLDSPAAQLAALRTLNPNIRILHYQYAFKGRPELFPIFQEWWDSRPGQPGFNCFLRDSRGKILLVKVWTHPMVNMTDPLCREAMLDKNIQDFKRSAFADGADASYDGIYWDLIFGHISWLGKDIDANGDGRPDDLGELDQRYHAGMKDFLAQLRASLPDVLLAGNEAALDYAEWMNGRLFEWQISNIMDGADFVNWDKVIDEYRAWTAQSKNPSITILQSSPTGSLAFKYADDELEDIPPQIMAEAQASYQRMRFGLTSALMGDGYYGFDFGPMIHGFPWWYDEYGAPFTEPSSTLPPRGYLGQPQGEPYQPVDGGGLWARVFEHGLVLVNPTLKAQQTTLPATYCKMHGTQAPLFETIVEDDQASLTGKWQKQDASAGQFGASVQVARPGAALESRYVSDLAYAGEYEVLVWLAPSEKQSAGLKISIEHAGGTADVILDARRGDLGWRSLGVYSFEAGRSAAIVIHSASDGAVIADAVKWVSVARYNDGTRVNQVILQPQDGIVLVTCKP